MTIQTLKDVVLPNGMTVKAGGVLNVPEHIGAALIKQGKARPRVKPGPTEAKDALPPVMPHVRVPAPPQSSAAFVVGAYEDQDNFVRDLVTLAGPFTGAVAWDSTNATPVPPVTPSPSTSGRDPVLTLDEMKLHCHIEPDQTEEDTLLLQYEMAARLHTENYLRYQIDAAVGENIKQACLMLVAHWYRNREAVSEKGGEELPMAYRSLLGPERDYPIY